MQFMARELSAADPSAAGLMAPSARASRVTGEAEARIVRLIFREDAANLPPRRIAAGLNWEGGPGPRGGPWNATAAGSAGTASSPKASSQAHHLQQGASSKIRTGWGRLVAEPEVPRVTKETPHPRIFEDATSERVQANKARYASPANNKRQTNKRLLFGLVSAVA